MESSLGKCLLFGSCVDTNGGYERYIWDYADKIMICVQTNTKSARQANISYMYMFVWTRWQLKLSPSKP